MAAVPGSGRGSTSNYTRAHKHHGGRATSATDRAILHHFTRPGLPPTRQGPLHRKTDSLGSVRDRLANALSFEVGTSEVVAGVECVGVFGAEDPLAVR
jgi:hypothetical protein